MNFYFLKLFIYPYFFFLILKITNFVFELKYTINLLISPFLLCWIGKLNFLVSMFDG